MAPPPSGRDLIRAERRVHRILRARFAEALVGPRCFLRAVRGHVPALRRGPVTPRRDRPSPAHHQAVGLPLVRQLERGVLVDVRPLEGQSIGVALNEDGRRRIRHCEDALRSTHECLEALDPDIRTRLVADLRGAEAVLRPRPRPWWVTDPF